MSGGRCFILDINPKGCEVEKCIATKVEVNPWMISTLKNEKFIRSMNPGGIFKKQIVVTIGILFALVKRQIGQGSSKLGRFWGRSYMSPFRAISFILTIET